MFDKSIVFASKNLASLKVPTTHLQHCGGIFLLQKARMQNIFLHRVICSIGFSASLLKSLKTVCIPIPSNAFEIPQVCFERIVGLCQELANGKPLWKKKDGDVWIYANKLQGRSFLAFGNLIM